MKTAINILRKELAEFQESLEKSKLFFKEGKINGETHLLHLNNLEPKIESITAALSILEKHENG